MKTHVLEVGCADSFGARLGLLDVKRVIARDLDQTFVDDVLRRMDARWKFDCLQHDLLAGPFADRFDVP